MILLRYTLILFSFFLLINISGCKKDPDELIGTGALKLEFDNVVGTEPLVLASKTYRNANQDPFQVTTFTYYISNIVLQKADGTEYKQPESYYLIDHENSESRIITIPEVPVGEYTGLTFTIGVDSLRNTSGAQTGALDPLNGMFWSWSTGYIFLKLEGYSAQSTETNGGLVFHVGGFKQPTNTIRTVSPSLGGNRLNITGTRTPEVHLKVDILEMFKTPTTVRFSELNKAMGGPAAVAIADNYRDMFSVDHIH